MNRILAALVNGAILGALLTAAVWLVLRLTPRHVLNAATRYAIWWATLAVALALPAFYLPPRAQAIAPARQASWPVQAYYNLPAAVSTPSLSPSNASPFHRAFPRFPIAIVADGWPRWILWAWGAASLLLLVRLTASFILLVRIGGRAFDLPLRLGLGMTRRGVRLAGSPEIAIPVAVGPWRPAVLIPTLLLQELGEQELEQILLHEASHLARRDDYALVLQRLVEALFPLHPVVRWIARRIDLEREVACDDRVIAVTGRPRSYATCLTRVVEFSGGVRSSLAAATAAEDGSHLARRVDMLLDKTRHTGTHLLKARLTFLVAAVIALAWMAGRSPAFVAFAAPLARTLQQAPARILPFRALLSRAAEQPPSDSRPFEWRVLEDSSGNPLASAEIRFHKAGLPELAADLDTDRNGQARAAGLPEGDYAVEVLKSNFVTASLKVHVPVSGLTVRLVRYGAIGGQVTDQRGDPVPDSIYEPGGRGVGGTRVAVLVKQPDTGQLHVVREAGLEGGRYRIFDLTPGEYAIGIWYDGLRDGSGFQLYPTSAHPRVFAISGGEEYDHIDFLITPQPTFQVSGKVEGPGSGDQYALALGVPGQAALPIARTLSEKDGTFRFAQVPAGSYDLFAGGPSHGYGMHDDLLGPSPLFGRMQIQVSQDVQGLSVALSPGRSLRITLAGEGGNAPPQGCPESAAVRIEPLDPWGLLFDGATRVTFGKPAEIRNLPPGRFQPHLTDLPGGCFQKNQPVVDLAAEPSSPVALELAPAGSVRGAIRGTARPAEFSVVLVDAGGTPGFGARVARPDAEGRFLFESLHPGRYRIALQPAEAAKSRWVADVSKMTEIEVAAGSPTQLDLPAASGGRQ